MRGALVLSAAGALLAPGPPPASGAGGSRASAEPLAGRVDPIAQLAYLKASNTGAGDTFGSAVALSAITLAVGAPGEASDATGVDGDQENDRAPSSGAVYVFVLEAGGWVQQAYLKGADADALDTFGFSLALDGDTLVVGAPLEDSAATGVDGDPASDGAPSAGAVTVFVRQGTSWTQQAYLKASNAEAGDSFGFSVALSGDTLVVGARGEDGAAQGVDGDQASNGSQGSGAAYVFVRSGTTWSQQAYLKASNADPNDAFGSSVALSGDTLVVGASGEDSAALGAGGDQASNSATGAGAAYVFARQGTSWSQQAYLKASNTETFDAFGVSVALDGDTVVVGAPQEDGGPQGPGSANGAQSAGAAYVFRRDGSRWSHQAYLKAAQPGTMDSFGISLDVDGERILVGAQFEAGSATGVDGDQTSNATIFSGAAYLFEREGAAWVQRAYLKASNTGEVDAFGVAVSLAGSLLAVGAPREDGGSTGVDGDQADDTSAQAGAAYAFRTRELAAVVFRNAGTNPASYAASPARIGQTFTATVDNELAGQTGSLLFAYDGATSYPLPGGQTLLCLDQGGGELFTGSNLFPSWSVGGVDGYALAIPNQAQLDGALVHTQALQYGRPPFVLSNAQDLILRAL